MNSLERNPFGFRIDKTSLYNSHSFGSCLTRLTKDVKTPISLGATATCQSIKFNINDIVLENKKALICRLSLYFFTGFVLGLSSRSRTYRFLVVDELVQMSTNFFPRHMSDYLIYGLIVIDSHWLYSLFVFFVVCFLLGRCRSR